MAKQTISIGSAPNDGTGDTLRNAFDKTNDNFDELYTTVTSANNLFLGNSTVNATITSVTVDLGVNSTSTAFHLGANGNVGLGNTTTTHTLSITGNLAVSSNTLSLGSSSAGANGYTYLPNGVKLNWGWVSANSTDGNATFASAFATAAYSVTATSNSVTATYQAAVTGTNTTVALIRTANATSTNVFYMAIGV